MTLFLCSLQQLIYLGMFTITIFNVSDLDRGYRSRDGRHHAVKLAFRFKEGLVDFLDLALLYITYDGFSLVQRVVRSVCSLKLVRRECCRLVREVHALRPVTLWVLALLKVGLVCF